MFEESPLQPAVLTPQQYREDMKACSQLLTTTKQNAEEFSRKLRELQQECQQKEFAKGIDFYDSKNLLLLQYLTELHFYVMFRLQGRDLTSGQGLALIKNLIYLKTLLMKLGPIERKLEYKVNKILKEATQQLQISTARSKTNEENDVRKYKPQPQNLTKERTTDSGLTAAGEKKYVAPKLTSTLMRKDEQFKRKQQRNEERRKRQLRRELSGVLMDDDQPQDQNTLSIYEQKLAKEQREKINYEEEYFTRLPESRKDKKLMKQARKRMLQEDVGDLSELDKTRELLRLQRIIDDDHQKEERVNRTLGIRKKIKKQ